MYQISEISNRDVSLLYQYRILRQPSDFLSAVYDAGTPVLAEIQQAEDTDFRTDSGDVVYAYDLGIGIVPGKIPYLEFVCKSDKDYKSLESLLYLDGVMLYSLRKSFENPVEIRVYWVSSLDSIQQAIRDYYAALGRFDLDALHDEFENRKNKPNPLSAVIGRDNNLVRFTDDGEKLTLVDSSYAIASALDAQLLVNPSQELLMSLPRVLKHDINISVTDNRTRYLSSFSRFTINIRGNGNWVLRDMTSGVDFVDGTGKINAWNCKLIHLRSTADPEQPGDGYYKCESLYAHRSLVILNQANVSDISIAGGSTLIAVPASSSSAASDIRIDKVSYIGYGCNFYSWVGAIPIDPRNILGLAWWCNPNTSETILYLAGRRIDEVSSEHDSEMQPNKIVEYQAGNIKITQGS